MLEWFFNSFLIKLIYFFKMFNIGKKRNLMIEDIIFNIGEMINLKINLMILIKTDIKYSKVLITILLIMSLYKMRPITWPINIKSLICPKLIFIINP